MKIRIRGNSVRLRLTKTEVEAFGKDGYIDEKTGFGDAVLTYALQTTEHCDMTADFKDGKITMYLPDTKAKEWVESQKVGFDANMDLGDGNELYLLLEKDYKCLDDTGEDQSDNYENPLAAQYNK
ncbi:MAG: hypothetical protein KDC11_11525 [Chitinophagaceae bacterium]|nr:hypothetical protein [Chitinophagaceae bacterium]